MPIVTIGVAKPLMYLKTGYVLQHKVSCVTKQYNKSFAQWAFLYDKNNRSHIFHPLIRRWFACHA